MSKLEEQLKENDDFNKIGVSRLYENVINDEKPIVSLEVNVLDAKGVAKFYSQIEVPIVIQRDVEDIDELLKFRRNCEHFVVTNYINPYEESS